MSQTSSTCLNINAHGKLDGVPIISEFIRFPNLINAPPKGANNSNNIENSQKLNFVFSGIEYHHNDKTDYTTMTCQPCISDKMISTIFTF